VARVGEGAAHLVDGAGAEGPDAEQSIADAEVPPDAPPPVAEGPYQLLSESGLYTNMAAHIVRLDAVEFEPEFKLWSDGAEKRRWIWLPPGTQIDTSDMDRWLFPIGTTAWKEFSDPESGKRLETRIIQRLSTGEFYFASFIWNADESDAVYDPTGPNVPWVDIPAGCSQCATPPCESYPTSCHVVPPSGDCIACHGGQEHRLLGFSAVQLSHDGPGLTLAALVEQDLLTAPPPPGVNYPVPGTPVERAAIGYLHANCGHCHTPDPNLDCNRITEVGGPGMLARVRTTHATVQDTEIYTSAVDQPLRHWLGPTQGNHTEQLLGEVITTRIVSGDASRSAVAYRMGVREWGQPFPQNDHQQMPYFATNEVDQAGVDAVELWINSLP